MNLDLNQHDQWTYIWGSTIFSSKRAYMQLNGTLEASPWFRWLWNSGGPSKHKFFFWPLLKESRHTRQASQEKYAFERLHSRALQVKSG